YVLGDERVICPENRPESAHARNPGVDALLVEVVAEEIDAVRAREIVVDAAVEIRDAHPGRFLHERSDFQVGGDEPAVLERHSVLVRELEIGYAGLELLAERKRRRRAFGQQGSQPKKAGAPLPYDARFGAVGIEEPLLVVFVARNELRDPLGQA